MQKKQHTVTREKQETELIARGRHDPCVVPRGTFNYQSILSHYLPRAASLIFYSRMLRLSIVWQRQ